MRDSHYPETNLALCLLWIIKWASKVLCGNVLAIFVVRSDIHLFVCYSIFAWLCTKQYYLTRYRNFLAWIILNCERIYLKLWKNLSKLLFGPWGNSYLNSLISKLRFGSKITLWDSIFQSSLVSVPVSSDLIPVKFGFRFH